MLACCEICTNKTSYQPIVHPNLCGMDEVHSSRGYSIHNNPDTKHRHFSTVSLFINLYSLTSRATPGNLTKKQNTDKFHICILSTI